ncbi:hypothetical protein B0T25DRAFT_631846 [Lasiosphaeria hispida]|uniref:PHD-type domain-containing protein n=1 Tax=Lasiosphaeria hispida TaxID=260671 RepID=A0AAJ0HIV9_9PEZI|nr:hypothetical protein B0T25DRAFT_631846 [Lasiosphaeria hispida]
MAAPTPQGDPLAGGTPASTPVPSTVTSPSPTRPPYIPQFTAATQMILKRMKGEPSSLSSALSAAPAFMTADIKPATYEDVRRRLVMGMNTSASMTMQMPVAPLPSPSVLPALAPARAVTAKSASSAGLSAIRKISSGMMGPGKASGKGPAVKNPSAESKVKKPKVATASRAPVGKRKRVKGQDDETSSLSSLSELDEPGEAPENATPPAPLTMTKSGRQVQKPMTYNPAAMDSSTKKRVHYGKRTAEQALCKKCTRMHSPASNQMVFCDGCNDGWHQMCHDPWIDDAIVRDASRSWYCENCTEKRNRHLAKKQKVEHRVPAQPPPKESWASKPPQQKRAYLMTLTNQELIALVMASLELHPDLPIFPGTVEPPGSGGSAQNGAQTPRSLFAGSTVEGLFPRADANLTGQINFVRKAAPVRSSSGSAKGRVKSQREKEGSQDKAEEEDEEYDPLAPLWPKPGKGLYSRLPLDAEDEKHLVDDDDYEAFSVIVYDERGRKVEENGMKV